MHARNEKKHQNISLMHMIQLLILTIASIIYILINRLSSRIEFNNAYPSFERIGTWKISLDHSSIKQNDSYTCAEWVKGENRKVLFVELHDWDTFYGKSKYKTGEYYVSACWDFALRQNKFHVDRVSTNHYYTVMSADDIKKYHLIFVRDPKEHRFYNDTQLFSKVRPMYFFGGWKYEKNLHNYRFRVPFEEKQIVSAYPDVDTNNTFLGYFPHNILASTGSSDVPEKWRRRVGFLLGKRPEYFIRYKHVIQSLLDKGWELHTTCKDTLNLSCPFPSSVIRHGSMSPNDFANLMKSFSMMLGFQKPVGSPSPIVAISNGVTFLNPLRDEDTHFPQHKLLSHLGFPYTYVIDLDNVTSVLEAAEWSIKYRFHSYIPPNFRIASLVDRMCNLLEIQ